MARPSAPGRRSASSSCTSATRPRRRCARRYRRELSSRPGSRGVPWAAIIAPGGRHYLRPIAQAAAIGDPVHHQRRHRQAEQRRNRIGRERVVVEPTVEPVIDEIERDQDQHDDHHGRRDPLLRWVTLPHAGRALSASAADPEPDLDAGRARGHRQRQELPDWTMLRQNGQVDRSVTATCSGPIATGASQRGQAIVPLAITPLRSARRFRSVTCSARDPDSDDPPPVQSPPLRKLISWRSPGKGGRSTVRVRPGSKPRRTCRAPVAKQIRPGHWARVASDPSPERPNWDSTRRFDRDRDRDREPSMRRRRGRALARGGSSSRDGLTEPPRRP